MTVEVPSPQNLDLVIRAVAKSAETLNETSIVDPKYRKRARKFKEAAVKAASQHRNWNPVMNSIDGMIDFEAEGEFPVGYREPAIDRNDYTGYEECVEEFFYLTTIVNLEEFKIQEAHTISRMMDEVGSLYTYSTQWDTDHGIFRD